MMGRNSLAVLLLKIITKHVQAGVENPHHSAGLNTSYNDVNITSIW